MTDMLLRGLPGELHEAIRRRAEAHGMTTEAQAESILHDAVFQDHLRTVLAEKGFGSALAAVGREFGITNEFDGLRSPELPRAVAFE